MCKPSDGRDWQWEKLDLSLVGRGSLRGRGHWRWQTSEVLLGSLSPLGSHHQPYHRPCRLQGWVTLGQTTNRREAQLHPLADNWIKVLLSTALPTRARPSFSHHQPLPSGSLHSLLASSTRGQTEEARTTIVLQPPEQKSQSQKVN